MKKNLTSMMTRLTLRSLVTLNLLAFCSLCLLAQAQEDDLVQSFIRPPDSAKPHTWWHWMNGNITKDGITADLEAMKRVGFGGAVIYEQLFTDRPDAIRSLTPEWLARVRFAAAEAARLGMVLEVNFASGYVSGGPWITPELGMQRLVASETS